MRSLLRSEYFKTAKAFNTATHNTTKVIEVKECPYHVLEAVINFMYGIDLPGPYTTADVESLLTMADLYLMEDLKDAVATHMAGHLDKNNIMDIYLLAEKYTAGNLKEVCNDFMVTCFGILETLGVDAAKMSNQRKEGSQDQDLKMNMIVRCKTDSKWVLDDFTNSYRMPNSASNRNVVLCKAGTFGRIVDDRDGNVRVKWNSVKNCAQHTPSGTYVRITECANKSHLEIITQNLSP